MWEHWTHKDDFLVQRYNGAGKVNICTNIGVVSAAIYFALYWEREHLHDVSGLDDKRYPRSIRDKKDIDMDVCKGTSFFHVRNKLRNRLVNLPCATGKQGSKSASTPKGTKGKKKERQLDEEQPSVIVGHAHRPGTTFKKNPSDKKNESPTYKIGFTVPQAWSELTIELMFVGAHKTNWLTIPETLHAFCTFGFKDHQEHTEFARAFPEFQNLGSPVTIQAIKQKIHDMNKMQALRKTSNFLLLKRIVAVMDVYSKLEDSPFFFGATTQSQNNDSGSLSDDDETAVEFHDVMLKRCRAMVKCAFSIPQFIQEMKNARKPKPKALPKFEEMEKVNGKFPKQIVSKYRYGTKAGKNAAMYSLLLAANRACLLYSLEKVGKEQGSLSAIHSKVADPNGKNHPFGQNNFFMSVADGHWECEGPLLKEIVERERDIKVKKYSTLLKQAITKGTILSDFEIDCPASEFAKFPF